MRKPMPNALDIDLRGGLTDKVTPHAGSALLIDCIRRSGVPAAAERHLPAKRSEHLRRDAGLAGLRAVLVSAVRAYVAAVPVDREVTLDVDRGRGDF